MTKDSGISEAASEKPMTPEEARAAIDAIKSDLGNASPSVSEAASETQPPARRKRGRPSLWTAEGQASIETRNLFGSGRGRNNDAHAAIAIELLTSYINDSKSEEVSWGRVSWLLQDMAISFNIRDFMAAGCREMVTKSAKMSVLTELGRIASSHGGGEMVRLAFELCDLDPKPSVKRAVRMLRDWRLQREGRAGTPEECLEAIRTAVIRFLETRSATSRETVAVALREALRSWLSIDPSRLGPL
jgi:hypothetical protein